MRSIDIGRRGRWGAGVAGTLIVGIVGVILLLAGTGASGSPNSPPGTSDSATPGDGEPRTAGASREESDEQGRPGEPGTARETSSPEEALAHDAASYAAETGVTQEEAERRLTLQSEAGPVRRELEALAPSAFAGAWLEHTPEFKLVVAFAAAEDDIAGIDSVVAHAPLPVEILFDFAYSLEHLRSVAAVVAEKLPGDERLAGEAGLEGMGIDQRGNRLTIYLLPESSWIGSEAELTAMLEGEFGVPFQIIQGAGPFMNGNQPPD